MQVLRCSAMCEIRSVTFPPPNQKKKKSENRGKLLSILNALLSGESYESWEKHNWNVSGTLGFSYRNVKLSALSRGYPSLHIALRAAWCFLLLTHRCHLLQPGIFIFLFFFFSGLVRTSCSRQLRGAVSIALLHGLSQTQKGLGLGRFLGKEIMVSHYNPAVKKKNKK